MSDERESHPVPDSEFSGKNLSEVPGILESAGYGVVEWTPAPNGQGKPEAVCIVHELGAELDGVQLLTRLWSRREVNRLITMLERHRDNVWPEQRTRTP